MIPVGLVFISSFIAAPFLPHYPLVFMLVMVAVIPVYIALGANVARRELRGIAVLITRRNVALRTMTPAAEETQSLLLSTRAREWHCGVGSGQNVARYRGDARRISDSHRTIHDAHQARFQ